MKESSLWTALFIERCDSSNCCHWIKFGHIRGSKIPFGTVQRIAIRFAKQRNWRFCDLVPYGPKAARWKSSSDY